MDLDNVTSIMLGSNEVVKLQIDSTVIWEKESTKTLTNLRVENTGSFVTTQYTNHDVNISGLRIVAEFSDGTESTLTSGYTYNPHTWTEAGSKTITFSYTYSGVTKSANSPTVTVLVDSVNSISIDGSWGSSTQYVGQTITLSDYFTVNAHYASGDVTPVTGYTYEPMQWDSAGSKRVKVDYSGKTAYTPYVTVHASPLVELILGGSWDHTQYTNSNVDTYGLVFTARYLDGTTSTIAHSNIVKNPSVWGDTEGDKTCIFTYTEDEISKSVSSTVHVTKAVYTITVVSGDTSKGTVSGTTEFTYSKSSYGQTVVLTTILNPKSGYEFFEYTPSVGSIINNNQLVIPCNVAENITVTASFIVIGDYLTFTPASGTVQVKASSSWDGTKKQYSVDGGNTWNSYYSGTVYGNSVKLRAIGATKSGSRWTITGTDVVCSGNIETILDFKVVADGGHPTMANYCFNMMFQGCTSIKVAPNLPATTLSNGCYSSMFMGCTGLAIGPSTLPAATLTSTCYMNMFQGCTGLTSAPSISATQMATNCCNSMFAGCTSLTTAPTLSATYLAAGCYNQMFDGCTSLVNVQSTLPATTLHSQSYYRMFAGCTSLVNAPAISATTVGSECCRYMLGGCISLAKIPALKATTLDYKCYMIMFGESTSLKFSETQTADCPNAYRIPVSGTGSGGSYPTELMFYGTSGSFTDTPAINTTYYTNATVV